MNSMYTEFSNQSLHLVHHEENESNGTRGNNLDTGDELTTQFSHQSLHLVHHKEKESLWYTWK